MSEHTPVSSILMFVIAAALGAVGSYLYKSGADQADGSLSGYLLNPRLVVGVCCYVGVMMLFVAAFRNGGALTVLYPTYASTFIFAALLARWAYGTAIRPVHILGMVLLVAGMYLMGKAPA